MPPCTREQQSQRVSERCQRSITLAVPVLFCVVSDRPEISVSLHRSVSCRESSVTVRDLCQTNVNVPSLLVCFCLAQRSVCVQREQCQMRVSGHCPRSVTLSFPVLSYVVSDRPESSGHWLSILE